MKDLATVTVGASGPMSQSVNIQAGSGGKCTINMVSKFKDSTSYEITVTASTASAMVLQASGGAFIGKDTEFVGTDTNLPKLSNTKLSDRVTTWTAVWKAPDVTLGSIDFHATCITGYAGDVFTADKVTSTFDANAVAPVYLTDYSAFIVDVLCWNLPNHIGLDSANLETSPEVHTLHCLWEVPKCRNSGFLLLEKDSSGKYIKKYTLDTASNAKANILFESMFQRSGGALANIQVTVSGTLTDTTLTTTSIVEIAQSGTTSGTPASSQTGATSLHADLSIVGTLSSDKKNIDIVLTATRNSWIAWGVTTQDGGMTAGGTGSDVFICTKGNFVQRYIVTSRSKPVNGIDVPNSACTYANGGVVMKFTRSILGGDKGLALTPGTAQPLIWAMGKVDDVDLSGIHADRNEVSLDVGSIAAGAGGTAAGTLKSTKWSLWLHIICMGSAWGIILPWGVALANRTRNVKKNEIKAGWFWLHKNLQYTGWTLQLLGKYSS